MFKSLITFLLVAPARAGMDTPTDGKYFYMEFWKKDDANYVGMHHVQVEVAGQKLPLWMTTQEHTLGLFTTECQQCNVDTKFELRDDPDLRRKVMKDFSDETCDVYDFTELEHVRFSGEEINAKFTTELSRWKRSFSF